MDVVNHAYTIEQLCRESHGAVVSRLALWVAIVGHGTDLDGSLIGPSRGCNGVSPVVFSKLYYRLLRVVVSPKILPSREVLLILPSRGRGTEIQ